MPMSVERSPIAAEAPARSAPRGMAGPKRKPPAPKAR